MEDEETVDFVHRQRAAAKYVKSVCTERPSSALVAFYERRRPHRKPKGASHD